MCFRPTFEAILRPLTSQNHANRSKHSSKITFAPVRHRLSRIDPKVMEKGAKIDAKIDPESTKIGAKSDTVTVLGASWRHPGHHRAFYSKMVSGTDSFLGGLWVAFGTPGKSKIVPKSHF